MKRLLAAYFSYSRMERLGITSMAMLLLLIFIFLTTMKYWVHPVVNPALDRRLVLAYNAWKLKEDSLGQAFGDNVAESPVPAGTLFAFDPNTLDSAGFIRLGLPAKALKGLLGWRRKGKHFYKPEDLRPLYNLSEETYARLAPFIRIADERHEDKTQRWSNGDNYPAIPAIIDLNTADSAMLDRGINGIGATLAHKIIARRTALGGFVRPEQLLEIYKFPDTTFQKIKEKLRIDVNSVRKMNLNAATLAQMSAHPYVGEKTAKNILLYREGIGHYERLEQLREVPLMSEEIYRKIAPYFVVE